MVRKEGDKERGRNEDEDENERGSTIISQFQFHAYTI